MAPRHLLPALITCMLVLCSARPVCAQSSALPARDEPLQVGIQNEYSVGSIDGEPWAQFGSVNAVAFDGRGRLYVLDGINRRVVVVGERGRLVRTIGREGRGPGEFAAPSAMAVFPDGSLVVHDVVRRTFSAFDSAGALQFDHRIALDEGVPAAIHPLPDGRLVASTAVYHVDGQPHLRTASGMTPASRRRIILFGADGRAATRLAEAYIAAPVADVRGMSAPIAFQPDFSMAVTRDGTIIMVDSTTYTLRVLSTTGARPVIRRPLAPRPVSDDDRTRERARRLALLEASGDRATGAALNRPVDRQAAIERERERLSQLRFAAAMPVISSVAADWAGRIWVQRTGDRVGAAGPIDVITPAGQYLGSIGGIPLPSAFGPDGRVAYIETDDLGVQRIRVSRIHAPGLAHESGTEAARVRSAMF